MYRLVCFVTLFWLFLSCSIWCVFVTSFRSFLSYFCDFILVLIVPSCVFMTFVFVGFILKYMVVLWLYIQPHTNRYYMKTHETHILHPEYMAERAKLNGNKLIQSYLDTLKQSKNEPSDMYNTLSDI